MIAVVNDSDRKAMPTAKLAHIQAGAPVPATSFWPGRGSGQGGIWQQHIARADPVIDAIDVA
jgi:hypothetical protein